MGEYCEMTQVKCTILDCITEEVPTINNYPLQSRIRILITMPNSGYQVVQKIIHEPLWYQRKYRLQIFSSKEKKIIPMYYENDGVVSMDIDRRRTSLRWFVSQALGLMNYDTKSTVPVKLLPLAGISFYAFLTDYRGKPSISRYYSDRTRGGEVFPEPFDVWYEPETIENYFKTLEVPNDKV